MSFRIGVGDMAKISYHDCFRNFTIFDHDSFIFEEGGKPNSCWSTVASISFFPFSQSQCGPATVWFSKYLILCLAQEIN